MGKTGKWLKNILTGKRSDKEKEREGSVFAGETNPATPISVPVPREKKRWSFRRSSASAGAPAPREANPDHAAMTVTPCPEPAVTSDAGGSEEKKQAVVAAVATAAAADAAVVAVMRLAAAVEYAAAVKIQSVFRSYLARKALHALKGLVKLQALVRGHLVRKQATATLRCMQALVTAQARARAQRIRAVDDASHVSAANHRPPTPRKSVQDNWLRHNPYHDMEMDMGYLEENIKIVEMDMAATRPSNAKPRNSYTMHPHPDRADTRLCPARPPPSRPPLHDANPGYCPASSTPTDTSPHAYSSHFEDFSFGTAQSSPGRCFSAAAKPDYAESLCHEFPSYMANTESSRAKARSQSAPKSRPADAFERQPSSGRRRPSIEGRNVPRAGRMQRSSSHVGAAAQGYHYPWSVRLDRSTVSLKDSECGSTSTVLTNTNYCRSLVGFDIQGNRY